MTSLTSGEDLDIMGQQCGVKAELGEGEGHGEGVWLRGPPQNQSASVPNKEQT